MEPLITRIIPFIRPQQTHAINVHPIALSSAIGMIIRVAKQYRFLHFIKIQLFEMFVDIPFPHDIPFPVYFNNTII